MTIKSSKKKILSIEKIFSSNPNFKLELDLPNFDSFLFSDVMISDWSGVALEFAFAFEKPVLYIDVPKKIRNPDFKDISQIPIEVSIREKIGKIISPLEIKHISTEIEMLKQKSSEIKKDIRNIREKEIFNIGSKNTISLNKFLEILIKLLDYNIEIQIGEKSSFLFVKELYNLSCAIIKSILVYIFTKLRDF
jgi:YidC/Oxa1 family membrane protein insertase